MFEIVLDEIHGWDGPLSNPMFNRVMALTSFIAHCAAISLVACSSSSSSPSCQRIPTPCSALVGEQLLALCDEVGCHESFSCTGTASCAAAETSSASPYPDLNCSQAPGCTWNGTTCTGTATPCTNAIYQQDSVDCENVGCTLDSTCGGGSVDYDCSVQQTQTDCEEYSPFCQWK